MLYNTCIGLQDAEIDSFQRDAQGLPLSKSRADLLSTIDQYKNNYQQFNDAYCPLDKTKVDCIAPSFGLGTTFDTLGTIVNREAGNQ